MSIDPKDYRCPECGTSEVRWLEELELFCCRMCENVWQPFHTIIWIDKVVIYGEEHYIARLAQTSKCIKTSDNPYMLDYYLKKEYPWRKIEVRY
jgi:hypothetical protein